MGAYFHLMFPAEVVQGGEGEAYRILPRGVSARGGETNHLTFPDPQSPSASRGLNIFRAPVCLTLDYLGHHFPKQGHLWDLGQNLDIWGSCREEAQKVTWEVMQELEAWELLPEDFLMPLREHACSLKAALQKDSKAGGL